MRWIKKNIWWIICSAIFGAILFLCIPDFSDSPLRFSVSNDSGVEEITVFEGTDGVNYVFLPSYAKMEDVRVVLDKGQSISIADNVLTDGMDCKRFSLETDYSFKDKNGKNSILRFYRSANLPAVYVDTATGSMEQIHRHKDVSEPINIDIYSANGAMLNSALNGNLKGRGNTTWDAPKKSYGLELSVETDLFGMGKATEWIFLANGLDETNLRNKIVFELAQKVGMEWVPEYRFIDLYLNGEYNGLYMLIEKVEVGESRLNIDFEEGEFLCKVEVDERWSILNNPIKTGAGRTIDLLVSQENDLQKEKLINEMESVLLSEDDMSLNSVVDIDSWAKRYLIDEISANLDSDIASGYFYYRDGIFYGGPIWDYDLSFSSSKQGHYFYAKQPKRQEGIYRVYYGCLYQKPTFYNRMVEIYQTEFVPALERLIEADILEYATEIEASVKMNGCRWSKSVDAFVGAERLLRYLKERKDFLSEAWIEGVVYYSVQVEENAGENYTIFSVKDGEKFETDIIDLKNTVWIIESTGEKFDPNKPILQDLILVKQENSLQAENTEGRDLRVLIVCASLACIASFVFVLIVIDVCRRRREAVK